VSAYGKIKKSGELVSAINCVE